MIKARFVQNQFSIKFVMLLFSLILLEKILIFFFSRLKDFSLDNAQEYSQDSTPRLAACVEICQCPEGYTGTSCEVFSMKIFNAFNLLFKSHNFFE
jgi:hypothetical protein